MNMLISTTIQSMDSLQISGLVQARHDSVKRTIERLTEQEVITLPPMVETSFKDKIGKTQYTTVYVFSGEQGKLDSITVVAQLCPQFTVSIVKRWQELENLVSADNYQALLEQINTLKAEILNQNTEYHAIKAMYDAGMSNAQIINAMGFSRSALDRRLRNMRQLGLVGYERGQLELHLIQTCQPAPQQLALEV